MVFSNLRRGGAIGIFLIMVLYANETAAQITTGELTGEYNTIQSAVPFLTIAPDSRAGAMGDAGVATSPDISSQHWNPAKYVFIDGSGGVAISYSPWLRKLVNDINLAYLVGYKKLEDNQVISGSLRYFSLGNIVFTNIFGQPDGRQFNPNEFAFDAAYSRLLTDHFSGAIAFRFTRSDLTGGGFAGDTETKPGISFASDLAFYYTTEIEVSDKDAVLSFGTNISNIGSKVSYSESSEKSFVPINFRLGGYLDMELDEYNRLAFTIDMNKLLVPTPPVYSDTADNVIIAGKDPNVSVPLGMLQSFYDAPGLNGSVFKDELHEITYSFGTEYWYREQFAIRAGYFYEYADKGNRKFFTLGIGLKLNVFSLDFSYLVPQAQNNPLANTLRFTLGFDFDKL